MVEQRDGICAQPKFPGAKKARLGLFLNAPTFLAHKDTRVMRLMPLFLFWKVDKTQIHSFALCLYGRATGRNLCTAQIRSFAFMVAETGQYRSIATRHCNT